MYIDTSNISNIIESLMDSYLEDISHDDYRFFFDDLRTHVLEIEEKYINETYNNHYSRLTSLDDRLAFGDINKGYKAQIQKYIDENELNFTCKKDKEEVENTNIPKLRNSLYIAIGGTIITVVLCFVSKIWIALVMEIIALACACLMARYTRKRAKEINSKQVPIEKKQVIAEQIELDITRWLQALSIESDRIISSFNFKFQ